MNDKKINLLYIDDEPHNLIAFKAAFRRDFNIFYNSYAVFGFELDHSESLLLLQPQVELGFGFTNTEFGVFSLELNRHLTGDQGDGSYHF